jgi:hypothetical protein
MSCQTSIVLDRDYFKTPRPNYTPYTYPHPLQGVPIVTAPSIQITAPTHATTYLTASLSLTTLAGTASTSTTGLVVTWTCATCTPTSGTATGTTRWAVPSIGLALGAHTITVTATDAHGAASAHLTVTYEMPNLPSDLLLHLQLDEGGDTAVAEVADAAGGDHPGTLMGDVTWVEGKRGPHALHLDGRTGYISVAGELGQPTAVTVAAWVKRAGPLNGDEVITIADAVTIRVFADAVTAFFYNGTTWPTLSSSRALEPTWHHLVYTAQANDQRLYVDGREVASGTEPAAPNYRGVGTTTRIGVHHAAASRHFPGTVDEVQVYSRALSVGEVAALYASTSAPPLRLPRMEAHEQLPE